MCGITGIYDRSGNAVDRGELERMTRALRHRGPDGEGYVIDGNIGLGHRRLSIIDIDGGSQPLSNEDDTLEVVFNGEIYNFVELRRELEKEGHRFRTRSDTEVIVHGYEQWGRDCVSHFNGMFAFAILDRRQRAVFLARDHLGIKPLYYTVAGSRVYFASEIRSLIHNSQGLPEINLDSLTELFTFRDVPSPKTLFNGIYKLSPGHSMMVTASGLDIRRYWNWVPRGRSVDDEQTLVARYQAMLEDTVRLQLRSDVPVGLYLSSGVDSGVLLALMSQHSSAPVQTFTIGFEGGDRSNEIEDARDMADRFGAEHHTLMLGASDYIRYFQRYMSDLEEPVAHEPAPAFYYLAQLASSHVKVALAGQGADEPWAGYDRYIGLKLSSLYTRCPGFLTRGIAPLLGALPLPMERLKRGIASLSEPDLLMRFTKMYSFFNADMKSQLFTGAMKARFDVDQYAARAALRRLQEDVRHLDPVSQMLYIDTRFSLPDDLLMVADKTSMANSLELRVPFLDYRLIEFVESLPVHLKLRGLSGKYLHKKAAGKWLPQDVIRRKKKGFAHPLGAWLRGPLRPLMEEWLLSSDSFVRRYFDQAYIGKILRRHVEMKDQHTRHIYLLASLELWHRAFLARP